MYKIEKMKYGRVKIDGEIYVRANEIRAALLNMSRGKHSISKGQRGDILNMLEISPESGNDE